MNESPPDEVLGDAPSGRRGPAMPLALASVGQDVILAEVRGGGRFTHRMAEMGLVPGTRFRVLSHNNPGPALIGLGDGRLVLGHGMVQRVFVYPA